MHQTTALLIPTYKGNEHLIPMVRENLDLFWKDRPRTFVASDGDLSGPDVIRTTQRAFTPALKETVVDLRKKMPDCTDVFLVLEDLVPLDQIDGARLLRLRDHMVKTGVQFVYLPQRRAVRSYLYKDSHDALQFDEAEMFRVSPECPFVNSLVAGWWSLDYLDWVIDRKLALGLNDPWRFENPLPDHEADHFCAAVEWPTVGDGVLARGRVNYKAAFAYWFPLSPVRKYILARYFTSTAPLTDLFGTIPRRVWRTLMNKLNRPNGRDKQPHTNPMGRT